MKTIEYYLKQPEGQTYDRKSVHIEEGGWEKPVFKQDDFMLRASLKSRFGTDGLQNNPDESIVNQVYNMVDLQKTLQKTLQEQDVSIIMLLLNDPTITTQKIATQLHVSRQTIATRIKKLQQEGYVKRIGPDKGGRWEVIV